MNVDSAAVAELLPIARIEILPRFRTSRPAMCARIPGEVVTAADEALERRLEAGLLSS